MNISKFHMPQLINNEPRLIKNIFRIKRTISKLPKELLIEIFSYLSEDDLKQVPLTCKSWNQIIKDNAFWKVFIDKVYPRINREKILSLYNDDFIHALGGELSITKAPLRKVDFPLEPINKIIDLTYFLDKVQDPITFILGTNGKAGVLFRYINQEFNSTQKKITYKSFEIIFKKDDFYQTMHIKTIFPFVINTIPNDRKLDYMKRLVNKQDCGIYAPEREREEGFQTEGTSTVYLI